ncbi:MAG: hypothetical protein H6818_02135 [Phycisphaerales bacterium]|nr:hypothetical protein [Phycisphaerales bacterium]MCB9863112.1 hypothetical protein [Phycisphaerales bacterium]
MVGLLAVWGFGVCAFASIAYGQPIDVTKATGEYAGGGVVLTADALRNIVRGDDQAGGPRGGGGTGNVLLVECNGAFGYSSIQSAIDAAMDGDFVVVLPNDCTPEGRWFENIDFLGKAIRVQSANPADAAIVEATVIDGNASGTVVKFVNGEGADSVLDGVTVTNGLGAGANGGGVTSVESAPVIRRSLFIQNQSGRGGGLYSQGSVAPIIQECRFDSNFASSHGSAISIGGFAAWPTLVDCELSNHGGSELFYGHAGHAPECASAEPCVQAIGCNFHDNTSNYILLGDGMSIVQCTFRRNRKKCVNGTPFNVKNCIFEENSGSYLIWSYFGIIEGTVFNNNDVQGALARIGQGGTVHACSFNQNHSTGVLLEYFGIDSQMTDCTFSQNVTTSSLLFGVLLLRGSIERCDFLGNTGTSIHSMTAADPGAIGPIRGCRFIDNESPGAGGAIRIKNGYVVDCLFAGNVSSDSGGAISAAGANVFGCTIVGNHAKVLSGGVTGAQITNSIVFNNRDANGDGHQSQVSQATTATFSNIQNLEYDFTPGGISNALAGNISLDPRFVDPGHWDDNGTPADLSDDVFVPGDYHLLPESPCVDGGDPGFAADVGATDFDGEARVQSCRVDMGVDEFAQEEVELPGDFDDDGAVTIDDVAAFLDAVLAARRLGVCRADLNGDGFADGRDIALLAGVLLGD